MSFNALRKYGKAHYAEKTRNYWNKSSLFFWLSS